jgi:hypothetical protein
MSVGLAEIDAADKVRNHGQNAYCLQLPPPLLAVVGFTRLHHF